MLKLNKILCGATLLCAAGFANAGAISFTDSVADSPTDITDTLTFSKFDNLGGARILESVMITITGYIQGTAHVQHTGPNPATIVTNLTADLRVSSGGTLLVNTTPLLTETFNASTSDTTRNYTYFYNTVTATDTSTFTDSGTLATFSSAGAFINLDFSGLAVSSTTGSGNLISGYSTNAKADVIVKYTFSDAVVNVSAPSQVAFLGLGLLAFARLRNTRK